MQQRCVSTFIIAVLSFFYFQSAAASGQTIEHIVILWLKEPGNADAQETVLKASQSLKTIPGVVALKSGRAVPSMRKAADSSFDIALIISFRDQAALNAYRSHPVYQRLLKEILLPLGDRIRVYNLR